MNKMTSVDALTRLLLYASTSTMEPDAITLRSLKQLIENDLKKINQTDKIEELLAEIEDLKEELRTNKNKIKGKNKNG